MPFTPPTGSESAADLQAWADRVGDDAARGIAAAIVEARTLPTLVHPIDRIGALLRICGHLGPAWATVQGADAHGALDDYERWVVATYRKFESACVVKLDAALTDYAAEYVRDNPIDHDPDTDPSDAQRDHEGDIANYVCEPFRVSEHAWALSPAVSEVFTKHRSHWESRTP